MGLTYASGIWWEGTLVLRMEILDAIYARFDRKRPRQAPDPFWW